MIRHRAFGPLLACVLAQGAIAAPAPELSRYFPEEGLVFYVEFDGLDAHRDAWRQAAAHAILNDTPAGAMMGDLARQFVDELRKQSPEPLPTGADLMALQESVAHDGFGFGQYQDDTKVLVLRKAGGGEARARIDEALQRIVKLLPYTEQEGQGSPKPADHRGRAVVQVLQTPAGLPPLVVGGAEPPVISPPAIRTSWWSEGDDFVLCRGRAEGPVDAVLDALEGKRPDASTHPRRIALKSERGPEGFEPAGLFFAEVRKFLATAPHAPTLPGVEEAMRPLVLPVARRGLIPPEPINVGPDLSEPRFAMPPIAPPLISPTAIPEGLISEPAPSPAEADTPAPPPDDDEDEALSPLRCGPPPVPPAPAEPRGPIMLGDQGPPADLYEIDAIAGIWGFQGKAFLNIVRVEVPAPRRGFAAFLDQPSFLSDRLPPIPEGAGDFAVFSLDPDHVFEQGKAEPAMATLLDEATRLVRDATGLRLREDILAPLGPTWALSHAKARPSGVVLVAELKDRGAFCKALDTIAARINETFRDAEGAEAILAMEALPAPARGYVLTSPAGLVPWLEFGLAPTLRIGEGYAAFAGSPRAAALALASEGVEARREGVLAEVLTGLPARLTSLSLGDPRRNGLAGTIVALPMAVHYFGGLPSTRPPRPIDLAGFFALAGIPRPDAFRVRVAPGGVPKAEEIEAHLFPSVVATTLDDRGLRIVSRDAIPLACWLPYLKINWSVEAHSGQPPRYKLSMGLSTRWKGKE